MSSVRQVVVRYAVGVLVATLGIVGAGTGVAIHAQRLGDLDATLLAAAQGGPGPLELEHARTAVRVWLPERDEVPAQAWQRAVATERPVWTDDGRDRLLLIVAEEERRDRHVVVAASARRMTPAESAGPFALAYVVASSLAVAGATTALSRLVGRAFAPVDRARADAGRVVGLGQGARLAEDGPEEVRALVAAMNQVLDRLDLAYAAQARFTAEAAHELRTPVAVMLGELDVALRRPRAPEEYAATLGSVREEVGRLRDLVDGLLALARLDAGQAEQLREPARASELVESAIRRERPAVEAAGGSVTLRVDSDAELRVHRALVEAAVGNLIRNAAVHAPGSPVEVALAVDGVARITVADRGPGPPEGDAEPLFDRFARDRSRPGLGLGLPIAREVARRHGGDCALARREGGGAVATLTLPVGDRRG